MDSSYNSPTTKPIYKGTQIIWYLLTLLEALLAFRFVLKVLGANPASEFVNFMYALTQIFVGPFFNVFPRLQTQGFILEWATLLAMFFYWFLAWAIIKLFFIGKTVSTPEAAERLNKQEDKTV